MGAWVNVKCVKQSGAVLFIKDKAYRFDALSRRSFAASIIKNHASWLAYANDVLGRGISLRDIVLVTRCDFTKEWSTATFDGKSVNVEASFNMTTAPVSTGRGACGECQSEVHVPNRSSPGPLTPPPPSASTMDIDQPRDALRQTDFNRRVFIRGYRIFHILPFTIKLKAAAEPQVLLGDFSSPSSSMLL